MINVVKTMAGFTPHDGEWFIAPKKDGDDWGMVDEIVLTTLVAMEKSTTKRGRWSIATRDC